MSESTHVGPKPPGPTHPTPSGPPRPGHLPTLGQVIRDAEHTLAQAINTLGRNFEPTSAPDYEAYPGLTHVDLHLAKATSHVRQALHELAQLAALDLPPVGSAVTVPARQNLSLVPAPGGPSNHRPRTGDGRSPGYAAAHGRAASGSAGGSAPATATSPVDTPGARLGDPPCPEAGLSSERSVGDKWRSDAPRWNSVAADRSVSHEPDRPTAPGLPPRPGERFVWPGTARIARSINASIAAERSP